MSRMLCCLKRAPLNNAVSKNLARVSDISAVNLTVG